MDCCKEKKYSIFITDCPKTIHEVFGWSPTQVDIINDFLKKNSKFLAFTGNIDDVKKISLMLAERNISHTTK